MRRESCSTAATGKDKLGSVALRAAVEIAVARPTALLDDTVQNRRPKFGFHDLRPIYPSKRSD